MSATVGLPPRRSFRRRYWVPRSARDLAGFVILIPIIAVALLGPLIAPHAPNLTVGIPGSGPSASSPLGTDIIGRDVLSRVLVGGRSLLAISLASTAIAVIVGTTVGVIAGYSRSIVDPILMRSVDVVLVFPPLLFFLMLVTAVGTSPSVLVFGTAAVLAPGIARLAHSMSRAASVRGYVEAAVVRGESTAAILRREILPNILSVILAQTGLVLTYAVLLAAAVNFLGIGLQPPKADWGVMISENRDVLTANPLALVVPAALIAVLTVGINLVTDSVRRSLSEGGSIDAR